MHADLTDTIIALATPPGQGAIGVIRISGNKTLEICNRFFSGKDLTKVNGHTVHLGKIADEKGNILDEVLCTVFKSPKSYTREDVVEISCHGSSFIIQEILQLFMRNGIRIAEPGEFTLRAFLNGQMDLSQAEAVADLIAAESSAAHDMALRQMRGGFSEEIKGLRQELIDFAALIELELDFSEEDVEFADRERLVELVRKIRRVIHQLLSSFRLGNVIKNGVSTVIAGRPNAGKSTLLNALLNEERAIVSEIAGTTRDTIEEKLNIEGIIFRLIDTAGIRKAQDEIERIGVERTLEKIGGSTLVIYVFDVTESGPEDLWKDVELFLEKNPLADRQSKKLFLANKMDLNPYARPEDYYKDDLIHSKNLITISAKNKMNIDYLRKALYKLVVEHPELLDQTIVSNSRHFTALQGAEEALRDVMEGIGTGKTGELIAMDIKQALFHLGQITGEVSTDDLLDSIFTRFCIGK